jgi:CRP-like cAMP-binding protein
VSDDARRSATVSALEPAETRVIHRSDFTELLRRHPSVDAVLLGILADQIRLLSDRLVEALYVPADTRIRRRLVELADLYEDDGAGVIPLTQEVLAVLAGTTRETVNRVLREEERRGVITLGRGRVEVLDGDGLRRRARVVTPR